MQLPKDPPYFSVIYPTYRPGGIDLIGLSLQDQPPIYELIVVDACPGRVERGDAAKYLLDLGIPLRYYGAPELPGVDSKKGMARAYNVGAAYATTPHLIFTQDYCWYPPGFMFSWITRLITGMANTSIAGAAIFTGAFPPQHLGDISIWEGNPFHQLGETIKLWEPTHWEMFNTYFPLWFFEQVNGLDERGPVTHCFAQTLYQMAMLGMFPEVQKSIRIGMVDHRVWGGELWNTNEKPRKTPEPVHELVAVSPNPYTFTEVRKICQSNGTREQ